MQTNESTLTLDKTKNLLIQRFKQIRKQTENICAPLEQEDYSLQAMIDVSPPKWHLAHTTWFFERFVLCDFYPKYRVFDSNFEFYFNSYYESIGERVPRNKRGLLSRPATAQILDYRKHVNTAMQDFLTIANIDNTIAMLLEIGMQHEQQHQELLITDLKYSLSVQPFAPAYRKESPTKINSKPPKAYSYLDIEEGIYRIGHEGKNFAFDNEYAAHRVFLEPYQIGNRLITNAEFIEFIQDNGYKNFNHWLAEGWDWVNQNRIIAPLYWVDNNGEYLHFTHEGLQALDPHAPVTHISFYEADAFARWKGARLPTEFEWEVACKTYAPQIPKEANFQEKKHFKTIPQQHKQDFQFYGNAWEWTNSAYLPYPNYHIPQGAVGEYNGKFMINQMVLRGGSCATPRTHIRPTYRNFFHPDKQWQFTGLRLAKSC